MTQSCTHKISCNADTDIPIEMNSSQSSVPSASVSEYLPSTQETQSTIETDIEEVDKNMFEKKCREVCSELMLKNPKLFLGIDPENVFIIKLLSKNIETNDNERNVFITLRKIKLNESYALLGCHFALSESYVGRLVSKTIPILGRCLRQLIFRPDKETILRNLPVAFRANYSHTSEIIDCFEIELQKPSNPVHQSLTWSEYKKCNTVKYLISGTPDGFVTYVSEGYGGKISDVTLVRECGYLETLEPNMVIMADRGFKHIENDLEEVGCKLLRPPSVPSGQVLEKEETLYAKQIAALRIHIERVIGRIREFAFLKPHSSVDSQLVVFLDEAVLIATGLINLQKKLIKY